jgi:hypothetical protein
MVQDRNLLNLLPRVQNVFEQLHGGVLYIFEDAKMYAFELYLLLDTCCSLLIAVRRTYQLCLVRENLGYALMMV